MHKLKSVYKKYIFPTIYNFVGGGINLSLRVKEILYFTKEII